MISFCYKTQNYNTYKMNPSQQMWAQLQLIIIMHLQGLEDDFLSYVVGHFKVIEKWAINFDLQWKKPNTFFMLPLYVIKVLKFLYT